MQVFHYRLPVVGASVEYCHIFAIGKDTFIVYFSVAWNKDSSRTGKTYFIENLVEYQFNEE